MSFTPGPWEIEVTDLGEYINAPDGSTIAGIWFVGEPTKANAHLIAAAPELYEALEKALQSMLTDNDQVAIDCDCRVCLLRREAIAKARAALAKVEDQG